MRIRNCNKAIKETYIETVLSPDYELGQASIELNRLLLKIFKLMCFDKEINPRLLEIQLKSPKILSLTYRPLDLI